MMKQIISLSLLTLAVFAGSSCTDDDQIFDKSAAQRLNETKEVYTKRLCASPNGWAMQYYPTLQDESPFGRGFLMLCRFQDNGIATVAMNNSASNNAYKEDSSPWEIITDNGPVLSFNSYNDVMHTFSKPDNISSVSGDQSGRGYEGDYEFIVVDAPADASYLMLKGKKRGTYNLLTPLEDTVKYENYLKDVSDFQNRMFSKESPTFDVIYFGDSIYKMEDANEGVPIIYPYNGDKVMSQTYNPFLVTKRGTDYYLRFRDKHEISENETVQDFRYNTEKDIFESVDNPAYYIDGDQPVRFYVQTVIKGLRPWEFTRSTDMSDNFKQLVTDLYNEMRKNLKFTFTDVALTSVENNTDDKKIVLRVDYNNKKSKADYEFTQQADASGITLTYVGPTTDAAATLLSKVPTLQTILDLFKNKFAVTAATTKFNLSSVKLTFDADNWVVVKLPAEKTSDVN